MIIAIDPGVSGGMVCRTPNSINSTKMPQSINDIKYWFNSQPHIIRIAYIEDVSGYFGKNLPSSRIFTLGENYGILQGCLTAIGIPYKLVKPKTWQRTVGMKKEKGEPQHKWKARLKQEAISRFSKQKKHITLYTADAYLILQYAMVQENIFHLK